MRNTIIRLKDWAFYVISANITRIWWYLPISRENKENVKGVIFTSLSPFFQHTKTYRNWREAKKWTVRIEQRLSMNEDGRVKKINHDQINGLKYKPEPIAEEPVTKIAIIIHVFHFEIFQEIMDILKRNTAVKFSFFITTPIELCDKITAFFKKNNFEYRVMPVDNRGRDILPFLKIIPQVLSSGHQIILKIHTKKSNHRRSGDLWRRDLYNKLLKDETMKQALNVFNTDHAVGLIGAQGHIVPMNLYYGSNAGRIEFLSWEMGVTSAQLMNLNFPAGSMFYIRKQALIPLLNQDLKSDDFEEETGQLDGTLAHAVERAFAISTFAAGLKFVDTTFNSQTPRLKITKDHPFTH